MKKKVVILALAALMLAGCGSNSRPKQAGSAFGSVAEQKETAQQQPVSTTEANPIPLRSPENGVPICDDEYVNIVFLGCEMRNDNQTLVFYVVNKTTVTLTFQANSMAINGESLGYVSGSDTIAPESRGKIRYRTAEAFPTMFPETISGEIHVVDFSKDVIEKGILYVTFSNLETP